jgi:hypothetical protein
MENLSMHSANRLEELQVRPMQSLTFGDGDDHRRARITCFVHGMAEPWDIPASSALRLDSLPCERVPLRLGRRQITFDRGQDGGQKTTGILRHSKEARASSQ